MLNKVRFFGVRKRINQIVEFLNDSALEIGTDWVEQVNFKFDNMVNLFSETFRYISNNKVEIETLKKRVDSLEKWRTRHMALEIARKMGDKIDDECITHSLEAIEGLDARISSLEELILPPNETEESSETNLPSAEEVAG